MRLEIEIPDDVASWLLKNYRDDTEAIRKLAEGLVVHTCRTTRNQLALMLEPYGWSELGKELTSAPPIAPPGQDLKP